MSKSDGSSLPFERLVFFTDAVLAISITLLVIDIRLPEGVDSAHVGAAVAALWPSLLAFCISFVVLGVFWISHHRLFGMLVAADGTLLRLNLLFLLFAAFLPFATSVLAHAGTGTFPVAFYAACVSALGLARWLLWAYAARRPELLAAPLAPAQRRAETLRSLAAPAIFLSSLPIAFAAPTLATMWWILLVPLAWWTRRPVHPRGGVSTRS